jgi:hypothetical protein
MLEPIGFAKFAPALREDPGGCESADHPKIARTAEGGVRSKSLFGSGLAGLGFHKLDPFDVPDASVGEYVWRTMHGVFALQN